MFGTSAFASAPFAAAGGNIFLVSVAETAFAVETLPQAGISVLASMAETTTAADATSCIFVFPTFVDEAATAQTTTSSLLQYPVVVQEAASAQTTASQVLTLPASVSEQINVVESAPSASINFAVQIAQGVTAFDGFSAVYLWNPIDDTQIPGWTDILRPTTIDLAATFGSQNFGAHAFAGGFVQNSNPNPATWNEIDDSQDPGWIVIDAV